MPAVAIGVWNGRNSVRANLTHSRSLRWGTGLAITPTLAGSEAMAAPGSGLGRAAPVTGQGEKRCVR
jgi:hypothetical protein